LSRAAAKRNEAEARELPALHLVRENEPAVEWADYPRLEPGDYPAYCKRAKWYWEPGFKRWTCILLFDVLRKSSQNIAWNRSDVVQRRCRKEAKGGEADALLPRMGESQRQPAGPQGSFVPSVFVRRMAQVRVADTSGPIPYSVVRQILEWSTGTPVNSSHSQGRHP